MPSKAENYLASYAVDASKSRGRLHEEKEDITRSPFQRDRDRIIHSTAFRRLEYKTQVFLYNEGDHYRTRLTHSIEVAQLARSLAGIFNVDQDLTEAIALAHDLGHSPFGHAGEEVLQECMRDFGGYDHNAQTIRILTKIEKKYIDFDGLNLSWETLEGLAKHNGPLKQIPRALREYNNINNLDLNTYTSIEAQIAAICDDIAYNSHDIEDGVRAGLFEYEDLFKLPVIGKIAKNLLDKHQKEQKFVLLNEARSSFIKYMVGDVIKQGKENLNKLKPESYENVRNSESQIIFFSKEFDEELSEIRSFLRKNMYKNYKVLRMTYKAKRLLKMLFEFYFENPECLPNEWLAELDMKDKNSVAIRVADFIAGMTDRYAMNQHQLLFETNSKNI